MLKKWWGAIRGELTHLSPLWQRGPLGVALGIVGILAAAFLTGIVGKFGEQVVETASPAKPPATRPEMHTVAGTPAAKPAKPSPKVAPNPLQIAAIELASLPADYIAPPKVDGVSRTYFRERSDMGGWQPHIYNHEYLSAWSQAPDYLNERECIRPPAAFYQRSYAFFARQAKIDESSNPIGPLAHFPFDTIQNDMIRMAEGKRLTGVLKDRWLRNAVRTKPLKRPLRWPPIKLLVTVRNASDQPLLVKGVDLIVLAYDGFFEAGGGSDSGMLAEPLPVSASTVLKFPNYDSEYIARSNLSTNIVIPGRGFGKVAVTIVEPGGERELSFRYVAKLQVRSFASDEAVASSSAFCVVRALTLYDFEI